MSHGRSLVYLVTGGCGFLGRHLLGVMLEKEDRVCEIRLFDKIVDTRLTEQSTDGVKVTVIQGDITDYASVRDAVRGADVVFHSASLVDVWHKVSPAIIHAVNVKGTENVIKACVELGVQYLVYTSSMEVVGPNVKGDPFIRLGLRLVELRLLEAAPQFLLSCEGMRKALPRNSCISRHTPSSGEGMWVSCVFNEGPRRRGAVSHIDMRLCFIAIKMWCSLHSKSWTGNTYQLSAMYHNTSSQQVVQPHAQKKKKSASKSSFFFHGFRSFNLSLKNWSLSALSGHWLEKRCINAVHLSLFISCFISQFLPGGSAVHDPV